MTLFVAPGTFRHVVLPRPPACVCSRGGSPDQTASVCPQRPPGGEPATVFVPRENLPPSGGARTASPPRLHTLAGGAARIRRQAFVRCDPRAESRRRFLSHQTNKQTNIARPFSAMPNIIWVHSSVARAADCRSAGPWFKSGCALSVTRPRIFLEFDSDSVGSIRPKLARIVRTHTLKSNPGRNYGRLA